MLDVTWHINAGQELYSASMLLDGLSALRRRGQLSLRFVPNTSCPEIAGKLVLLTVHAGDEASARKIIVDFWDTSEFRCPLALDYADVYFKRSLMCGPLEALSVDLQHRVRAFGLNFACVSAETWSDWLAASVVRARAAATSDLRSAVAGFVSDLRDFPGIPPYKSFLATPHVPKRPIAVFQTRVWPPRDSRDSLECLNRERAELVKHLRDALGDRFVGGIVDSELARARYPNAVVTESVRRHEYASLIRSALVGVYSRGIDGSLAFKLSEYLAAGCCIVIEPLSTCSTSPCKMVCITCHLIRRNRVLSHASDYLTTRHSPQKCLGAIANTSCAT